MLMEKAFDRVPREVISLAMRKLGVDKFHRAVKRLRVCVMLPMPQGPLLENIINNTVVHKYNNRFYSRCKIIKILMNFTIKFRNESK